MNKNIKVKFGFNAAVILVIMITLNLLGTCKAERSGSKNLLKNPTLEQGSGEKPAGWNFHGSHKADWTKKQLDKIYAAGRPVFMLGRAKGEWSDDAFSGKRSLKLTPVEPPLSPHGRWYGLGPHDGYWYSDDMLCEKGESYLASAWIKVDVPLAESMSYGFLQIWFYDKSGKRIQGVPDFSEHRPLLSPAEALGYSWGWYPAPVYQAPANAQTMRLVFITEWMANKGGFGTVYADNFSVYKIKSVKKINPLTPKDLLYEDYWEYIREAVPPKLPALNPDVEANTIWASVDSDVPGEIFFDKDKPVLMKIVLRNILEQKQALSLEYKVKSWMGKIVHKRTVQNITILPWQEKRIPLTIPATNKYGGFFLEVSVKNGKNVIQQISGRFAVMSRPENPKPEAAGNFWQVSGLPLQNLSQLMNTYKQTGSVLEKGDRSKQRAFFINLLGAKYNSFWFSDGPLAIKDIKEAKAVFMKNYDFWHKATGMEFIGMIKESKTKDIIAYKAAVRNLAMEFKDVIHVWMCLGVEAANAGSYFRKNNPTDDVYDLQVKAAYEAIKEVDPSAIIFTGAIATDYEAKTLQRLYEGPAEGSFDGVTINMYSSYMKVCSNNLSMMDLHGDKNKPIQIFEIAEHIAPLDGPQRSGGERQGAAGLVRASVKLLSEYSPRLQRIAWFQLFHSDISLSEYAIITSNLQPRSQYVAYVVMADKLGYGRFVKKIENRSAVCYLWKDGNRKVAVAWSGSRRGGMTFNTDAKEVSVTDIMGNTLIMETNNGLLTLPLSDLPVYVEGFQKLDLCQEVSLRIKYGTNSTLDPVSIKVKIENNGLAPLSGKLTFPYVPMGLKLIPQEKNIPIINPQDSKEFNFVVDPQNGIDNAKRYEFSAQFTTNNGQLFRGGSSLNFARCSYVKHPPSFDGTKKGWAKAIPLLLADRWQVTESVASAGDKSKLWNGVDDISGKAYALWDENYFYLMVDVRDNVFAPWKERSFFGFTGDSIEFAVQPDNIFSSDVRLYKYEAFLSQPGQVKTFSLIPDDCSFVAFNPPGKPLFWRHFPVPNLEMKERKVYIKPTGRRGNCVYQIEIPWSDLGVNSEDVKEGKVISFVLNVNDNDGEKFTGGRRAITWFTGLYKGNDPSLYGDLILVK